MPSLAFRKASICSRFSFSASCTLVVNPQHATRSRLILYWTRLQVDISRTRYYICNKVMQPAWNLQSPAKARRQFPKPFGNISISSRVTGSSSSCTPTAPFSYCPRYRFRPCAASLRARGVQLLRKWTRRSQPGLRKGIEPPHENDWSRYKHFGSVLCAGRPSAVAQSHCGYGTASDGTKPWVREYCCARGDGVGTGTLLPPQKARNCHCYRADTWGRRAVGGTRSRGCHRFDRAMGRTGLICRCSRRRNQQPSRLLTNSHIRPESAPAPWVRASVVGYRSLRK